jgi:DNA polymerase III subunit beta
MQFEIQAATLHAAVKKVSAVVERRNTIPILSNVLIEVSRGAGNEGTLKMTATDLDIVVTMSVPVQCGAPGGVTLPAATLQDYTGKLAKASMVTVETARNDHEIVVACGRSRVKMLTLPVRDFPDLDLGGTSHEVQVPGKAFAQMLQAVRFAISTEETRYYLNGIYLHVGNNDLRKRSLTAVATDGHRLAVFSVPHEGLPSMPGIIVPRKTVLVLQSMLDGFAEDITLRLSERLITADIGPVSLRSKLIDGTYPDYERVIPRNHNCVAILERSALTTAADRVMTVSKEKGRALRLLFDQDKLTAECNDPDGGSGNEEIAMNYGAEKMLIGVNGRYLQDALGSFSEAEDDKIRIGITDPGTAITLKRPDDPNRLAVIMPMRA